MPFTTHTSEETTTESAAIMIGNVLNTPSSAVTMKGSLMKLSYTNISGLRLPQDDEEDDQVYITVMFPAEGPTKPGMESRYSNNMHRESVFLKSQPEFEVSHTPQHKLLVLAMVAGYHALGSSC